MTQEISVSDIVRKILKFVDDAVIDARVINTLFVGGSFLGKEHSLWDYKEKLGDKSWDIAKTVRSIVSFHNTYGGYLVYGVKSLEKDTKFAATDNDGINIDLSVLKQAIKNYTGRDIDITYRQVDANVGGQSQHFGILHIPKRIESKAVLFTKNSPRNDQKKALFEEGEAYWRNGDQCNAASNADDWAFLHSHRHYPGSSVFQPIERPRNISHNLPDKNVICPSFVGRTEIIKRLHQWLNDDFVYVMALVGEGGRGKTSIAVLSKYRTAKVHAVAR